MEKLDSVLQTMEDHHSPFENSIRKLAIPVCDVFGDQNLTAVGFEADTKALVNKSKEEVKKVFPVLSARNEDKILKAKKLAVNIENKRIAVLFSGGPASGGHNVIVGIKKALGTKNTLLGVIAGPKGLLNGDFFEIKEEDINTILNTGGFDFLGSDRTKIKTAKQFEQVKKVVKENKIDGIVIVGGDDSNTNAALLAEVLAPEKVTVVGVPKTIDGDMQIGDLLPITFGFDTATKIYSEMVGNILQDTPSSRKYWHFIKLMGRSASHVTLEVALATKPAYSIISEEIWDKKLSLSILVNGITDVIIKRYRKGIQHGVVLLPEGFIEFIPEMRTMINALNDIMGENASKLGDLASVVEKREFVYAKLSKENVLLLQSLPTEIEEMLLLERDSHGNLPVSQIPTEILLIGMVQTEINRRKETDATLLDLAFNPLRHFFGYEGRCGAPTLFDATYCLNLGLTAGSLVLSEHTGYMAAISDFDKGGTPIGIPLLGLLNVERRDGTETFVIEKALVKLDSPAFKYFVSRRDIWASEDHFASPGPRQLWGPSAKQIPYTVALNQRYNSFVFDFGKEMNI